MACKPRGKHPVMTKQQAEGIMETEVANKDFWTVSEDYDNFFILQGVLDVLYNCVENNNYQVKYSAGQYIRRLLINCGVCRKDLTSYDPFISHDKGKPHKRAVQVYTTTITNKQAEAEDLIFRDHLTAPVDFDSGSLEEKIYQSHLPVVGIHHIYKEKIGSQYVYTCQLCVRTSENSTFRISDDQMFKHVCSDCHTLNYMHVAHGFSKNCRLADIKDELMDIIRREGTISANIAKLKFDDEQSRLIYGLDEKNTLKRPRALSQSPSRPAKKVHPVQEIIKIEKPHTTDQFCQTDLEINSITDLVKVLENCVEEQNEIKPLVKSLNPGRVALISQVVRVLSHGLKNVFAHCKDDELEGMVDQFDDLVLNLK